MDAQTAGENFGRIMVYVIAAAIGLWLGKKFLKRKSKETRENE